MAENMQIEMDEVVYEHSERALRFLPSLACGAFAGLTVDLTLYPIDTIKTRLQSPKGFLQSGGFRSLFAGVPSVALGSAPGSALFFATYEGIKRLLLPALDSEQPNGGGGDASPTEGVGDLKEHFVHATAATWGEIAACSVRVPTEVVKQRTQASPHKSALHVARRLYQTSGWSGFYTGYASTVMREIPFSLIQFPLWEALKAWTARRFPSASSASSGRCTPLQGAMCGSAAGGVAAALTTPLDVIKTRIMLCKAVPPMKISDAARVLYAEKGLSTFSTGIVPRTVWMSLGGLIFFGAFEFAADFHRTWRKEEEDGVLKSKYREFSLMTFPDFDGPWDLLAKGPHMLIDIFMGWVPDTKSHKTFDDARQLAEERDAKQRRER